MDDFINKAKEDAQLHAEFSLRVEDCFFRKIGAAFECWRSVIGDEVAERFVKTIVTGGAAKDLINLLLTFFTAGYTDGQKDGAKKKAD